MSDISPFKYKKVNFVSEEWLSVCQWARIIVYSLQWPTYIALIYIIIKRSPRVMGSYKWYLIWNVSHGLMLSTIAIILQPYPLSPYTIILLHGIFDIVKVPQELTKYAIHLGLIIFTSNIYTTVFLFLFRWAQTIQHKWIQTLSNMKVYTLLYISFIFVIIVGGVLPMHSQILSADQIKSAIKNVDPQVYTLLLNEPAIFGFNADDGNKYYLLGVIGICFVGLLFFLFLAYCSISTYLYIVNNRQTMHEKTAVLYMKLLNLLIIDVGIILAMFFLPGITFIIAQLMQLEWTSKIVSIALIAPELYPLATNLLLLLYIKPYREEAAYIIQITLYKYSGKRLGKMPLGRKISLFSTSYA